MNTTQLIIWGIALMFFAGLSGFGFGMSRMAKSKNKEISELVRKIAGNEQDRRERADSLRKISLKYVNIKRDVKKLIKEEDYPGPLVGKASFIKALKEIINE